MSLIDVRWPWCGEPTPGARPARRLRPRRAVTRRTVARCLAGLGACGLVFGRAPAVHAQSAAGAQVEGRIDVIAARASTLQLGGALNVPAGRYVRLGGAVAAGGAWRDGTARGAARGDLFARFLLDPFRQSPVGLYGIGGVSVMYDGFERTRPRLLVGAGVESRVRGRHVLAAELALGGGVRAALVLRRARRSGR